MDLDEANRRLEEGLDPGVSLIGKLYVLVGTPVLTAMVVSFTWSYIECWLYFGHHPKDHIILPGGALLALIPVIIAIRAYLRTVVRKEGKSAAPLITRAIPALLLLGVGFGVFMSLKIHDNRMGYYESGSVTLCIEALCPKTEDEWFIEEEECAARDSRFADCKTLAWECQREAAAVEFEQRSKAEETCVREGLSR